MNLVRLIYASRFCHQIYDSQELSKINNSAQKNNKAADITGMLVISDDYFLQCLEGDRVAVSQIFNKISLDQRHDSIVLLSLEHVIQREFADWEMKFVILTKANSNLIREFSTSTQFNPFTMHFQNALGLMKALRK